MDIADTKHAFSSKRIWLLLILAVILIVGILMLWNANGFRVQNIFDALYLEVDAVSRGKDSALLSITEDAKGDYDFGEFSSFQIPELNMWIKNGIGMNKCEILWISFYGYGEDGKEDNNDFASFLNNTGDDEDSYSEVMSFFKKD